MKAFLLKYRVVDILTLCIALGVFLAVYRNVPALFAGVTVAQVAVIVVTALLVHTLKATRLFLALYGQKISISEHLALYCKVTPVSMVLPYKVGEFYRMYAYGTHLHSGLKGIVIILLDRFMDTAALVTMILLAAFFYGGGMSSLLMVLLIFLVLVVLLYRAFPSARAFWKHYFLTKKATPRRMGALKALEGFHRIPHLRGSVRGHQRPGHPALCALHPRLGRGDREHRPADETVLRRSGGGDDVRVPRFGDER